MNLHASRSRYETFQRCQRLGYLQYHFDGKGITRKGKSMFLTTGTYTHLGLEMLLKETKKKNALPSVADLDYIIAQVREKYRFDVFQTRSGAELAEKITSSGFDLSDEGPLTDFEWHKAQLWVLAEQSALVEAFIRVFYHKILVEWWRDYKIVMVEKDMTFPFVKGVAPGNIPFSVIQSATIDVVLQHRETKDIFIGSFKTAASYDTRKAKANAHDTQGLSETWAFEKYALEEKGRAVKTAGVLMLFFIKGRRQQIPDSVIWETINPLIRGYRRMGLDGVEYAHSYKFPNPKNASGWGYLGKGWEPFYAWQSTSASGGVGGVKGWIDLLLKGEIQPECGDVLEQFLRQPESYLRTTEEVTSWLIQTQNEELRIGEKLVQIKKREGNPEARALAMDTLFPQSRGSCHYPMDCSMLSVCHGTPEERTNPLGSGEFCHREPHHEAERLEKR